MANGVVKLAGDPPTPIRTIDNGDGTFSLGVASTGGASSSGTLTNRSGTIATGATAQSMMSANSARRYLLIQNPTTGTESFWINFTTTAVRSQPSIEFAPGVTLVWEGSFIPTEAVSVIAATTGTAFVAKEG